MGRNGYVQINGGSGSPSPRFAILNFTFPFNFGIAFFAVGSIIGGIGQQIILPIYLSTFGHLVGAYWVLWFSSFSFTVIFGIAAVFQYFKGAVTGEMRRWKWIPYLMLIGLFDSMNGFMTVYSSFLGRVPGALQSILLQASLPVTLIFSKAIVGKTYNGRQMIGASLVVVGITISLIPLFIDIHNGLAENERHRQRGLQQYALKCTRYSSKK
eukprot:TRINITY_DN18338_c0_g1_i1.p1 TRINITY_DN18338_c0_g1~~TRINITY_DN18338_c0_g1_i1.p1  ORF type:complete len:212 (+),score=23.18 TRINITY_DN18338_c0_g1_i1:41-676(+)